MDTVLVVIDITVGERHKSAATRRTHPKEARTVIVSAALHSGVGSWYRSPLRHTYTVLSQLRACE